MSDADKEIRELRYRIDELYRRINMLGGSANNGGVADIRLSGGWIQLSTDGGATWVNKIQTQAC